MMEKYKIEKDQEKYVSEAKRPVQETGFVGWMGCNRCAVVVVVVVVVVVAAAFFHSKTAQRVVLFFICSFWFDYYEKK